MSKVERLLSQEDRTALRALAEQLTSACVEYTHSSIAFEELKAKREQEELKLRNNILLMEKSLQELGKSLCAKYGVPLSEGSWSLDVVSGSFKSLSSAEEADK